MLARLLREAADLEGSDDTERAVVLATVAIRIAMRADTKSGSALGNIRGDQRADGIAPDAKTNLLQLAREVLQRVLVDIGVGVAADRLITLGEVGSLGVDLQRLRDAVDHVPVGDDRCQLRDLGMTEVPAEALE